MEIKVNEKASPEEAFLTITFEGPAYETGEINEAALETMKHIIDSLAIIALNLKVKDNPNMTKEEQEEFETMFKNSITVTGGK